MPDPTARLEQIRSEAQAAIDAAASSPELEQARVRHLGRSAELTRVLRSIAQLPADERGRVGQAANALRQELEDGLAARAAELERGDLERRIAGESVDVTLPGDPALPLGHLHLVTQTRREMEDVFVGLGFEVFEGPEVEFDYYNFTALNIPAHHPARLMQDSFYFSDEVVLRTHTSPMQVRAMEAKAPPIYAVFPGRVYRRDSDATHTPMFHQLEGLAIDEWITLADLRGTLLEFVRAIFGRERDIRLRSGYFPFTEPSVEVDVSCFACDASGVLADGQRCGLCRGSGWIEIAGAGMVDPNVLGFVADSGYDPEVVQGYAFGFGIDRIAMLRHAVPDLRMLFDNDARLLEQFGAGP